MHNGVFWFGRGMKKKLGNNMLLVQDKSKTFEVFLKKEVFIYVL